MPLLHSLIHFDGEQYRIETVLPNPPLKVNGREQRDAVLQENDRIHLGDFEFVVRCVEDLSQLLPPPVSSAQPVEELEEFRGALDPQELTELSAVDLVNRIEQEQAATERFESRRSMGAEALLQAAAQSLLHEKSPHEARPSFVSEAADTPVAVQIRSDESAEQPDQAHVAASAQSSPNETERVFRALNQLLEGLERRSERLAEREVSLSQAAAQLLDVQHQLTAQMETILKQAARPVMAREPTLRARRAIA